MEGITKIVGIIVAILLILVGGYFGRGFIERGVSMAQGVLGETGDTAKQTLENMNQDILLSMTTFTVTIKKGDQIVATDTLMGYSALQGYLQNYNIDVTTLTQDDGTKLTPDTLINLYQSKCSGSGFEGTEGSLGEEITFSNEGGMGEDYTVTVIVTLPKCED